MGESWSRAQEEEEKGAGPRRAVTGSRQPERSAPIASALLGASVESQVLRGSGQGAWALGDLHAGFSLVHPLPFDCMLGVCCFLLSPPV